MGPTDAETIQCPTYDESAMPELPMLIGEPFTCILIQLARGDFSPLRGIDVQPQETFPPRFDVQSTLPTGDHSPLPHKEGKCFEGCIG